MPDEPGVTSVCPPATTFPIYAWGFTIGALSYNPFLLKSIEIRTACPEVPFC
jgi:hypothetical protein